MNDDTKRVLAMLLFTIAGVIVGLLFLWRHRAGNAPQSSITCGNCHACNCFGLRHQLEPDPVSGEMRHVLLRHPDGRPQLSMSRCHCAFPTRKSFVTDNWNCQTMVELRRLLGRASHLSTSMPADRSYEFVQDDARLLVARIPDTSDDPALQSGFLVLSWYKERGRTSQAMVFDGDSGRPLTYATAQHLLNHYSQKHAATTEVANDPT